MIWSMARRRFLQGSAMMALGATAGGRAFAEDPLARARAEVTKLTGMQTVWDGPTTGPKAVSGKHIVYMPYDESNDSAREWGTQITEAGNKVGWKVTVINGRGSPEYWLEALNQAIALNVDGICICADAATLQAPITVANQKGIVVIGVHAAAFTGPQKDLGLFCNIAEDPAAIGHAQADWVIAHSNGAARVIITTDSEFAIAQRKAQAVQERILECKTCQVLEFSSAPIGDAAQRQPELVAGWIQKYGTPIYITSIADYLLDFQVPALQAGAVDPSKVILVGSDGQSSAYSRIRAGDQYQQATVPEPYGVEGYQVVDEFNRAFQKQPATGYAPLPYLVTRENIDTQGGKDNVFIPANDFARHYEKIWGVS